MSKISGFAILLALIGVSYSPNAHAQYVDKDDLARFDSELDRDSFMATARFRAVMVPPFLLGLAFDEHANNWQDGTTNFAYGVEFSWRRNQDFEIGLAIDYADLSMPGQFWLASDDPPEDADWTTVDIGLLSLVLSSYWFWDVNEWFSPYLGGGIGPALVIGEVNKYNPRPGTPCRTAGTYNPPGCVGENGEPDLDAYFDPAEKENIPPVLPVLNLTLGARFNISKHGVLKLEFGFQNYLFAGIAAGGQW